MDHHRGDAAEPAHRGFNHADGKRGRDCRIDGVAAGPQDLEAGRGGKWMHGGHHAVLGDGFAFVDQPVALRSIHVSSRTMLRRRPTMAGV